MATIPRKSGKSRSANSTSKKKADADSERDRALLEQLKDVGARIGIEVREERLVREVGYSVRSGHCRVNGQEVILLDRNAAISERTDALLESLATCDLTEIYIEPEIRQLIRSDADVADDAVAVESKETDAAVVTRGADEQSSGA